MQETRPPAFYWLALLFGLFVLFLYGPTITILILSFQGPDGGLTFPMNGVSLHWFQNLFAGIGIAYVGDAFWRSLKLGFLVASITVVFSVMAGLAFRRRFHGSNIL